VYAIGGSVAGPQESIRQPHWLLRLARTMEEWNARLRADRGIDYGIVPGEIRDLPWHRRMRLRRHFKVLNPDLGAMWSRPKR
jgi:hypothetical protein